MTAFVTALPCQGTLCTTQALRNITMKCRVATCIYQWLCHPYMYHQSVVQLGSSTVQNACQRPPAARQAKPNSSAPTPFNTNTYDVNMHAASQRYIRYIRSQHAPVHQYTYVHNMLLPEVKKPTCTHAPSSCISSVARAHTMWIASACSSFGEMSSTLIHLSIHPPNQSR